MAAQVDAAARREPHALGLEQPSLPGARRVGETDLAAGVDDSLPWNLAARGQVREHATDEAGAPRQARELGDLAVAGHATLGDRLDGAADRVPVRGIHGGKDSIIRAVADDQELMRAWCGGDARAGAQLSDRYMKPIGRFFANRGHATADVEDLVQRTFVGAAEGLARYRGKASVRTWLFAIAHNVQRQWMVESHRRRAREQDLGDKTLSNGDAGLHTILNNRHERRILLEALRRLELEAQLVLQLRYWDGVSTKEIAEILGSTPAVARNRLRKAKHELLAILDGFARELPDMETTVTSLEDWAKSLREDWVGES